MEEFFMNEIIGPQKSGRGGMRFGTKVSMKYVRKSALTQEREIKEGTVTNMSTKGIQFETAEKLPPGAEIQVEILLGKSATVRAAGKVLRSAPRKESGCHEIALGFTEISNAAKEEINMWYYAEKIIPGSSGVEKSPEAQERKSERFRVSKAFAEYRKKKTFGREPWKQAEVKQVSKHGLLLSTRAIPKEGEIWEVMIHMAVYPEPIKAVGKVQRVKWKGLTSIVAVEFTRIRDGDREKLTESTYVKEILDKSDDEIS
jgi:c-di-GMP-binding flagellar brake protein YcgR